MHAWLDDSDDYLRWLAPTDLNLDYMGFTHLDCVTLVLYYGSNYHYVLLCNKTNSYGQDYSWLKEKGYRAKQSEIYSNFPQMFRNLGSFHWVV